MSFKKHGTFRAHVKRIHNHSISSLRALISEEKEENKPFQCSLCSRQFNKKRSFQDHMKRKHNQSMKRLPEDDEEDKLYNCPICSMCFKSHSAVYYHKRRKHPDSATTTEGDINASSNIDTEKVENENTESSELIRCKFCNKEIPGNRIKYHEKRHIYALNRKRKYLCSFCPREYNSETSVKLHEKKIHLREKPEPKECPICQKKVDPHYLKHHIDNVHTSERKFVCDVCGDSFKSYVLLHSHKRLHLERNFPCTVCTKKFIRSFDLKVHMRIHTGEEPYSCHICDRRFKIKVRLNYHLQRHAGIKRKCKECGKEFNHVKQLKIHSYKHTGMPYRCSVCDYACAQRDVFRKHLLRMHDMTMTPDEYCAMFKANTGRNPHVKTLEELQSEAQNMEQEELSKFKKRFRLSKPAFEYVLSELEFEGHMSTSVPSVLQLAATLSLLQQQLLGRRQKLFLCIEVEISCSNMQCRACMQMDCVGAVEMCCAISADGKTLCDYFNDCTQLHATSTDNLPQLLCLNCTQIVRSAYNFKEIARRSDEELRNILVFPKTEPEMIYANTEQPQDAVEWTNDPLATVQPSPVAIESSMSIPELDIPTIDIKFENPEELCQESQGDERGDSEVLRDKVTHPCKLCDCIYTTKKELKNHIFDIHKPHIICIKCPKFFDFPKELQLHESLVHATESPMQCPWCKEYHPREVFNKHLRSKHSKAYSKYFPGNEICDRGSGENTSFRCEHCERYFSSVLELADHIQEHAFDCPICSMRFKKHSTFRAHVKRIHNHSISSLRALISEEKEENKPFQCSICSKQFKQKRSFRDHMKRKHNEIIKKPEEDENKLFQCSPCSRQFNKKRSFQDHMKRKHNQSIKKRPKGDEKDKLYNCPICNMCFKSHSAVFYHKRRRHPYIATTVEDDINASSNTDTEKEDTENSELIRCKFCNKEIPGNRIKYHEKRHIYALNRKKKYLCSFCPREFYCETSVKLHEKKIHLCANPERKECPICQKEVDPDYLKYHIDNVHASERKFACDVCGDSFKSYVRLQHHKRLHLERKFPCTICTKKFIRSSELKVHMRSHTGEEPYSCHICDRRFKIKVRLSYHLQQHAGIKRKCKECGKEFNDVKQLKMHSFKHTGMPYRCSVCGYACAQRNVFRNHLLRMHDMTMTPDEYCAMFKANTGRNPHVKTLEELKSGAK
ncbi:PREDICTED: uncharacterized protein LOC108374703 [Rhagoletis zephyria]|uniref:uncharacterized protein LOC108374703 n=1 Tax=Rhagoletis zephyria TaxID=28612 RepID=UPI0008118BB0|nr:PREDICTED: uncharacterized protein LOC108374703 [Rhagoletis zephyria]